MILLCSLRRNDVLHAVVVAVGNTAARAFVWNEHVFHIAILMRASAERTR